MKILNFSTILISFFTTASLWASEASYRNYNNIVSDLQNQLKTKRDDTTITQLKNSSYSLGVGLNSQIHEVNDDANLGLGLSAEVGIYNFLIVPLKVALLYSTGDDMTEIMARVKTDHSFYKYNFFDLKVGLASGFAAFTGDDYDFSSLFISPSIEGLYQVHRSFDVSLNIAYLFHSSSRVNSHFNPSVNIISYF